MLTFIAKVSKLPCKSTHLGANLLPCLLHLPLQLVIEPVKFMLQHLAECDALGLTASDTQTQVLAPLTRCTADGRAHLEAVISRIRAGLQTNLSVGLFKGLDLHVEILRYATVPSYERQCA